MYLSRILVVAWFGLSIFSCSNNDGQQRAKEDRNTPQAVAPEGFQSDELTTLSPDVSFGIRTIVKEPTGDQKQFVFKKYVVDSLDLESKSHRIIGELKFDSDADWQTFCDSDVVAYTAFKFGPKDMGDVNRIYLYRCTDGAETVLLESSAEDSSTHWINELVRFYDINLRDSLVVYEERVGADIQFAGKRLPMRVVVRRILPNGETPLIKTIENAEHPSFSSDGTQVFADRWTEQRPNYYSATVVVYDLETDSVSELDLASRISRSARRLTRDDPIFYLGAETENWVCADIRLYDPQSGVDTALTSHSPHTQIWQYYVTPDSIVYLVPHPDTNGRTATRWRTLLLNGPK